MRSKVRETARDGVHTVPRCLIFCPEIIRRPRSHAPPRGYVRADPRQRVRLRSGRFLRFHGKAGQIVFLHMQRVQIGNRLALSGRGRQKLLSRPGGAGPVGQHRKEIFGPERYPLHQLQHDGRDRQTVHREHKPHGAVRHAVRAGAQELGNGDQRPAETPGSRQGVSGGGEVQNGHAASPFGAVRDGVLALRRDRPCAAASAAAAMWLMKTAV